MHLQVLEASENALASCQVSDDIRELLDECSSSATDGERSFIRYTEKDRRTCTFGRRREISLDARKHSQLVQCYKDKLPEYGELCEAYANYKEATRRQGRIPTSMGNWTPPSRLSLKHGDALTELLSGPPTVANMFSKATLVDKERGMLIHLRCSLEEDDFCQRKTRSSYIQGEFIERDPPTHRHFIGNTEEGDDKYVYFGRIHHFLVQQFAGQPRELAYVEWFKPPFFHEETKMWRVDLSLGLYKWLPYIFVDDIQSQVVVAQDPDDNRNLWILSSV